MDDEMLRRMLDRIATALEVIAENTKPDSEEEHERKIRGFGGQD